jgi:hypothetical protein
MTSTARLLRQRVFSPRGIADCKIA